MFYVCQIFTICVRTFANLQQYGHKCRNGTDTNAKPKNTILFDFSLSSHFFIYFLFF